MAEPEDAVVAILRSIQKDLSDTRKSLEAKINDVAERVAEQGDKLDAIKGYLTHLMGSVSMHRIDIETLKAQVRDMHARMSAVEARS